MQFDVLQFSQVLSKLTEQHTPFVTVTIVSIRGSVPQVVGAKAIVIKEGIKAGTVGGGKIEAAAIAHAQTMLTKLGEGSHCDLVTWNLQTDIGMTCGGEVQLLFEAHTFAQWPIAIFGAGHIAQALIPLLLNLDCRIICIDPRSEWLSRLPDNPKLSIVCTDDMPAEVTQQPPETFFLLMTRGHATDLPILSEILSTRTTPFVGVIGSQQKANILKRDLQTQGLNEERIASFHCPLGLPFGNNTPAEISISIAAQLLQHRDKTA